MWFRNELDSDEVELHRTRRDAVRQTPVRPWLTEERKQQRGQFSTLLHTHLKLEDPVVFHNFIRLTPELFDEVLQRIANREGSHQFQETSLTTTSSCSNYDAPGHFRQLSIPCLYH